MPGQTFSHYEILEDRPEGSQILRDARLGKFDQLLVYKLDRLGRETRLILNAVAELEKHGVRVRSMTEEFDTGTATGRLMLTMLSGFASHEREVIRERSMAGTVRVAQAGAWMGGIVPYGYRKAGEKRDAHLVISEEPMPGLAMSEADVIREVFRLAAVERKSCRFIAARLNQLRIPCAYVRDDRLTLRGREAAEAFIRSQKHEGWELLPDLYDDGGYTGGNMDRPALQRLIDDINRRAIDCVVVYKVDRLSRSLLDFAKLMELFDKRGVSFVSVTQQFNTTNSLGRLTLNILLSFAQFEREIISERTRDKLSAARKKGKWIGGHPVLGYDIDPKGGRIVVNADEAQHVRAMYDLYLKLGTLNAVWEEVGRRDWRSKQWTTEAGVTRGGKPISKSGLYGILTTRCLSAGKLRHHAR